MGYVLRAKKCELVPDGRGFHIKISMVGIYSVSQDGEEKWIKWVKITDLVMQALVRDRVLKDETAKQIIDGN